MIRLFGKIPFFVTPAFWIVAGLISYLNAGTIPGTVIWLSVIFISVLVHELGHALTALLFGLKPSIELIAFGGVTRHFSGSLSLGKQFLIVLAGPLFGFCLFLLATFVNYHVSFQSGFFLQFFKLLQGVNLFWTIVNILPVFPLDGGQMLRLMFEAVFGKKGVRYALVCSFIMALFGALFFFSQKMFLVGVFFSLFAYQSYLDFRKVKENVEEDLTGDLQKTFSQAERSVQLGQNEEALAGFYEILEKVPSGKARLLSSQYLALLEVQKGNKQKAYELLLPFKERLNDGSSYLLQQLAFEMQNYLLVAELSARSFRGIPNLDVALSASKAHAQLGHFKECIGWFESALELGLPNPSQEILDPLFDPIKNSSDFMQWKEKRKF